MPRKLNAIATLVAAAFLASASLIPARADDTKADNKAAAGANRGGLLPGETRDDKRERLVNEMEKQTGSLTKDQKTHIKAIFEAAGDEMAAARANYSLTEEQRNAIVREVHGSVFKRIDPILTATQRANLKKANQAKAGRRGDGSNFRGNRDGDGAGRNDGGLRPGETRDEKRDRLVAGLEKQTGPLTADQKKHIKAIYEAAGDEMGAARANYSLTEEQRNAIVREVHGSVGKRIDPILTEAQRASLQKSRDEHRAKRNAEKKEQK